ncbi:MAG: methyltransferase domain-containing protein [Thermoplasmata archaeon]
MPDRARRSGSTPPALDTPPHVARSDPVTAVEAARDRFRSVDEYRADREWNRYEGTPQRDLFRELRERFLDRHRCDGPWVLEIGPGPGRFTYAVGTARSRRALLDLSDVMLRRARARGGDRTGGPPPDLVKGDGFRPPVRDGSFGEVVALGNVLGFAPRPFAVSLQRLGELVAPGGVLVIEIVPGWGERSRYLTRLPPTAVGRLLRSPIGAVLPRIEREAFSRVQERAKKEHAFQRRTLAEVVRVFQPLGWSVLEAMAVAPALGFDPERIAAVRPVPRAWTHLLEVEEALGRIPERWEGAAAMMVAVRRPEGQGAQPAH